MAMPDWLQGPLDRALRDLQGDAPIPLGVRYDGDHLWFDAQSAGMWIGELRGAELTVRLADEFVEQIFPESQEAWGEPRPQCPGHGHPMLAELQDGEAWWLCPHERRRVARIGELAQPATDSQRA